MKLSYVIAPAPVVRPRETAALVLLSAWTRYVTPMVLP